MTYLHEKGIVHRDLKPENVLIKEASPVHVLLSDFGVARQNAPSMRTQCGTAYFLGIRYKRGAVLNHYCST